MTMDDLLRLLQKSAGLDLLGEQPDQAIDRPFADLGLDSLALLETLGAIEREFSITLPDSVAGAETPREMFELVSAAS
jgi:act minimal PKS acyl carrier protein